MPSLATLAVALPVAAALTLLHETPDCTTFAASLPLSQYNATFLNATYYPVSAVNISIPYGAVPFVANDVSFCEVLTSISYGNGNNTLISATWMPDRLQYNERFLAIGNGGMAGTIDTAGMLTQLNSGMGFAISAGDAGHRASDNNAGGGAPGVYLPYLHDEEQVLAWIRNAISLFTPASKALTAAYYGKDANHAFYSGCSTGGAQGMALAQFHPELFDGIVAGCPGNWYSHLALSFLWNAQQTANNASKLSQAKLNLTTNAVLDACDLDDGVADRVLENPLACTFDLSTLACSSNLTSSDTSSCLTAPELTAALAIYAGPKNSATNASVYPGFSLGSEIEWELQQGNLASAFSIPILQNLVYANLSYDASTFNWASSVSDVDARASTFIDAIDPDLTPFKEAGGKLLMEQGWADPFNAATWPIEHWEQIREATAQGGDVSDWLNLFMVPGGGHCGGASFYPQVPGTYHTLAKMVQWVERGDKPDKVLSTGAADGSATTRKLCAWPATARYAGGDEGDFASYVCE